MKKNVRGRRFVTSPRSRSIRAPRPGGSSSSASSSTPPTSSTGPTSSSDLDALRSWLRKRGLIGARDRLEPRATSSAPCSVREALRSLLEARDVRRRRRTAPCVRSLNAASGGRALRVSFDRTGAPRLEPAAGGLDRALARALRDHRARRARRHLGAPQGLRRRRLPVGVLRPLQEPLAQLVQHGRSAATAHKAREYRRRQQRAPDAPSGHRRRQPANRWRARA